MYSYVPIYCGFAYKQVREEDQQEKKCERE